MKISQHFHWEEFHPITWNQEVDPEIDDRIVEICEQVRTAIGAPLIITSGVRTKAQNQTLVSLGKASPASSHLKGLACDLACTESVVRWKIINTLLANGVTRIGVSNYFIHFDIDKGKVQNVIWTY